MMGLSVWGIVPLFAIPIWYALPLIVAISLVHGATRHELMRPILISAGKFGGWVIVFMIVLYSVLQLVSRAL